MFGNFYVLEICLEKDKQIIIHAVNACIKLLLCIHIFHSILKDKNE